MGIFKAGSKFIARTANDSLANHQMKNAYKVAYKKTGNEIKQANKEHKHIDCKRVYKRNLAEVKRKIEQGHHNRSKFIDEI